MNPLYQYEDHAPASCVGTTGGGSDQPIASGPPG